MKLILCIAFTTLVGFASGMANVNAINSWYTQIQKPSFNPPNYLFGPVWTVLYILMGVSLYLIIQAPSNDAKKTAYWIFGIQLLLNALWSFIFFYFHQIGFAFIEIAILWIMIIAMIWVFYGINKTAALIQIPYLLWVTFASVLNFAIWRLNS
ncbi:MAG: TspO/MBR family protein [Bacteroidota bacterium]|nr:TspO/MBR family protein [Bacteroidota bacterium]